MEGDRPGPGIRGPVGGWGAAVVRGGWGAAVASAVLSLAVLGVVAEALSFLLYAAAGEAKPSTVDFARIGGAVFYAFHRVGFVFEVPRSVAEVGGSDFPFPVSGRFTASYALMGGTVLAGLLLYRSGRAVADRAGGNALARGIHGAKVGLPYAVICAVATWGVRFSIPFLRADLRIHPSYAAAALWPLGLGILFGFLGGFRSRGERAEPAWQSGSSGWARRAGAAVSGGWWMLAGGLALSFAGLLVLAAVKPDATRAYFSNAFRGGLDNGSATIVSNLFVAPNMAAWVLFPSMGSCLGISGGSSGLQGSLCFLSYTRFPSGGDLTGLVGGSAVGGLPGPPLGYYAFILAPLVAVLAGGMVAAKRSRAERRGEAVAAGVVAGAAFGLMAALALVLSIISVKAGGEVGDLAGGSITVRLGPELAKSILLAFVWGMVGGGMGGWIQARRLPAGPRVRPSMPGPPELPAEPGPPEPPQIPRAPEEP
jgi:hypothetical protein